MSDEMNELPLISCVVPTFNRAAKLVGAIESIISQTYCNIEILVVDDQSGDDTKEKVAALAEKDYRINYLYNPVKGANNARNFGIQNAKGEYIAFLDDDDRWVNTKLEKQLEVMQHLDSKYGVVYCTYARKAKDGKIKKRHPGKFSVPKNGDILEHMLKRNSIGTPTLFVKSEVFAKCGMFNPKYKSFQDWELLTRIACNYYFYYLNEVLVDVYESNDSITRDKSGRVITKYMHLKQFIQLYKNKPRLLSTRYSSLGFTLVKLRRLLFAKKFLIRSLKYNKLNFEALILLLYISCKNLNKK